MLPIMRRGHRRTARAGRRPVSQTKVRLACAVCVLIALIVPDGANAQQAGAQQPGARRAPQPVQAYDNDARPTGAPSWFLRVDLSFLFPE